MNRLLSLATMLGIAMGSGPLGATTIAPWDLAQMTLASNLVVRGEVLSLGTARETSGRILTEAVVAVQEVLRGEAPETVTVLWPGGEWNGQGQRVAGTPGVQVGQEVVLFLARQGPPSLAVRHVPVSLAAGVLTVHRLPNQTLLHRDLRGLACPDGLEPPPLPGTLEDLRRALRSFPEAER